MLAFSDYLRAPSSIQLLLDLGERLHLSHARLLSGTGLTLTRIHDVNGVVTPQEELGVIANLIQHTADPAGLGLVVGQQHQLTAYGILGYGMLSSRSLLDAMQLTRRFMALTYTFVKIRMRETQARGVIHFEVPAGLAPALERFVLERAMAATARVISDMTDAAFVLDGFHLAYPSPRHPAHALPVEVMQAPIQFGQADHVMIFNPAQLTRLLPHANPVTAAMCERLCTELIGQRRTTLTTAMVVRDFLQAAPKGSLLSVSDVAMRLHISERTLKRKLQGEGTSFSLLQTEVLRQRADQLLAGPMSLSEIAEELGFADLSTFSQAYKRWTGVAPSVGRSDMQKG